MKILPFISPIVEIFSVWLGAILANFCYLCIYKKNCWFLLKMMIFSSLEPFFFNFSSFWKYEFEISKNFGDSRKKIQFWFFFRFRRFDWNSKKSFGRKLFWPRSERWTKLRKVVCCTVPKVVIDGPVIRRSKTIL